MMKYKGYVAQIDFDRRDGQLHGRIVKGCDGNQCGVTFQARSVAELGRAFQAAVDDYLAWKAVRDEPPNHPLYLMAALQR